MTNKMKKELLNDVLTGLLVASAFAIVAPHMSFAQGETLDGAVGNTTTNVFNPFVQLVSYISYGVGTVMVVAGIAGAKKHADQPGNNPLGPALGKLGAGAAFLAAPQVVGLMQGTGSTVANGGPGNFTQSLGTF